MCLLINTVLPQL